VNVDVVIASDRDRDDLFAEIQVNGQPWAEVSYDRAKEAYLVTFLPPERDEEWPEFDLVALHRALGKARDALVAKGYPDLKL
jgi:hypothetical protein